MASVKLPRLLVLVTVSVLVYPISGCGGGGGGGDSGVTVGDASPAGIWRGTIDESQGTDPGGKAYPPKTYAVEGIVLEDGSYVFVNDQRRITVGEIDTNGDAISGDGLWASFWPSIRLGSGFNEPPGGIASINGTISERRRITGEVVANNSLGNGVSGSLSLEFDDIYLLDSSLDAVVGTYTTSYYFLTFDALGRIFGQTTTDNCVLEGDIAIIDPQFNSYRMQLHPSNCTGDYWFMNGLTFSGFAYLDPSIGPHGGIRQIIMASLVEGNLGWPASLARQ